GGITTLVDMPLDSVPTTVSVDALLAKRAAAEGRCWVDVGFWAGALPGNLGELAPLHQAGVLGFKCFLADSGSDDFPPVSTGQMERALGVLRGLGSPLLVHAESAEAAAATDGATAFKCSPPIREAANRELLWSGLRDGVLDLVVSDHSPSTAAMKELGSGDFGAAWGGISSLQLGLPVTWTQARRRGFSLGDV